MHLFLCGGGSGKELLDSYNKTSNLLNHNKPILYIPLAMPNEKYDSCYEWFSSEVKYFNHDNFKMVRSNKELFELNFNDFAMIFIGGGNTFKLLSDLKQYNLMDKINKYLNNGGIVFGGSAGAIIFGKNIGTVVNEDDNYLNTTDLSGFNLAENQSIICHLNKDGLEKNDELLRNISINNNVLYLSEDNVLYYNNETKHMYGTSEFYIYEDGNRLLTNSKTYNKSN